MNTTTLQIPLSPSLREQAQKQARAMGFSSLQEAVRLFLNQLAKQSIKIRFVQQLPVEILTSTQESHLDNTTSQIHKDLAKGSYKKVNTIEDMMNYLQS